MKCLHSSGFTLIEILVTIAIIGTLASIALPAYNDSIDQARYARAIGDLDALAKDILVYEQQNKIWPANTIAAGWGGRTDPWGNPYQYTIIAGAKDKGAFRKDRFLVPLNSDFDLYSMGKDGQSQGPLSAPVSADDIIRANDGGYIGLASKF